MLPSMFPTAVAGLKPDFHLLITRVSHFSFYFPLVLLCQRQWRRRIHGRAAYMTYVVQRKMVVHDNFKLPALPPNSRGRCCGSSHGWLIIADDSLSITLLNPFNINGGSRCRGGMIRLPPIIVPPGFEFIRDMAEDEDEYISEFIHL